MQYTRAYIHTIACRLFWAGPQETRWLNTHIIVDVKNSEQTERRRHIASERLGILDGFKMSYG